MITVDRSSRQDLTAEPSGCRQGAVRLTAEPSVRPRFPRLQEVKQREYDASDLLLQRVAGEARTDTERLGADVLEHRGEILLHGRDHLRRLRSQDGAERLPLLVADEAAEG